MSASAAKSSLVFMFWYALASEVVTSRYDSIAAKFVARVAFTKASASFITIGAAI